MSREWEVKKPSQSPPCRKELGQLLRGVEGGGVEAAFFSFPVLFGVKRGSIMLIH